MKPGSTNTDKSPMPQTAKPGLGIGKKIIAGVVAAAVVGAVIGILVVKKDSDVVVEAVVTPFINPPVAGLEVPTTSYQVNAGEGGQFTHTSGSLLKIPANAFLDADGKVVSGMVDVSYREFHNPVDIIFSGIPMNYDSGGVSYHFESAGMLDVIATQAGKPLKVNPDNKINVDMVAKVEKPSTDAAGDFNMYLLDTVKQRWVLVSTNSTINAPEPVTTTSTTKPVTKKKSATVFPVDKKYDALVAQLAKVDAKFAAIAYPLKPRKAHAEKQRFDITFEELDYPEIVLRDGAFFEPAADQVIDPKFYKIPWKDAPLERDAEKGLYRVTLSKDGVEHTYKVYPVYMGSNYTLAMKMYDKKVGENQVLADALNAERKRLTDDIAARKKTWVAESKAVEQKETPTPDNTTAVTTADEVLYRTFTVTDFGVTNCARPIEEPEGELAASFKDDQGNELSMSKVFVMETDRNMVSEFKGNRLANLKYNPKAENVIVGITTDNKVVKLSPEKFADIPTGASKHDFTMEVVADKMKAPAEVEAYLKVMSANTTPSKSM